MEYTSAQARRVGDTDAKTEEETVDEDGAEVVVHSPVSQDISQSDQGTTNESGPASANLAVEHTSDHHDSSLGRE